MNESADNHAQCQTDHASWKESFEHEEAENRTSTQAHDAPSSNSTLHLAALRGECFPSHRRFLGDMLLKQQCIGDCLSLLFVHSGVTPWSSHEGPDCRDLKQPQVERCEIPAASVALPLKH
jgi:hypothetical protein